MARPLAPAFVQECTSSLMVCRSQETDGVQPSNTQEFRCFRIDQAARRMSEEMPFLWAARAADVVLCHQSRKRSGGAGAAALG